MEQRVLVTAGASGIGLSIAEGFAQTGATVFVCDVNEDALTTIRTHNDRIRAELCDVSDPDQVGDLFHAIKRQAGGLDVLVNNAGIAGPAAPIADITDTDWRRSMEVNVNGAFWCIREAAPLFQVQKSGCIINISTTSVRTGLPLRLSYVTSKSALSGLTKNVARELGPYGVRCNMILPGAVDNARGRAIVHAAADKRGVSYEQALSDDLKFISMRTLVSMEDIAQMAVFLASDGARHVSGQEIGVCGNAEWE